MICPLSWDCEMSRKEREMIKQIRNAREEFEAAIDFAYNEGFRLGFQQGLRDGLEQSLKEGLERGLKEDLDLDRGIIQEVFARSALSSGFTPEETAAIIEMDLSDVLALRDRIQVK